LQASASASLPCEARYAAILFVATIPMAIGKVSPAKPGVKEN
jgi:hypothetical protein